MTSTVSRRSVLLGSLAGAVALSLSRASHAARPWGGYDAALVIDGCASPGNSVYEDTGPLADEALADLRSSGVSCICVTVGGVANAPADAAFVEAVSSISRWESEIDRHPDTLARIRNVTDIDAAKRQRRTGLCYAFQDGISFESDPGRLEVFHRLGVRVIQPTYNRRNLLGDGCLEADNAGLSRTGVEAIRRMNDLAILVDLSHCGRRTAADAIRLSRQPVVFSHTGCAAIAEHPRNRTDAELRAVADKGGVAGIYFMPYLRVGHQPTAADVIRHLEHAIDVAGEDHVSIGSDGGISPEVVDDGFRKRFAEITRARVEAGIAAPGETETGYLFASDLNMPRRLETLAGMLSERGWTDARIEKVLGLNLRRVFADVWRD
jgi:membrane dipeptidase